RSLRRGAQHHHAASPAPQRSPAMRRRDAQSLEAGRASPSCRLRIARAGAERTVRAFPSPRPRQAPRDHRAALDGRADRRRNRSGRNYRHALGAWEGFLKLSLPADRAMKDLKRLHARPWLLAAVIVALVAGHGIVLYYFSSHLALPAAVVSGVVVLVVVK